MTLRSAEQRRGHRIWDELAQFKAADSDAALAFLLKAVAQLIGADDALWVGAVRMRHGAAAAHDPQHGWRGRAVKLLRPTPPDLMLAAKAVKEQDTPTTGMTTIAVARAAGKFRAIAMRSLVDMAAFRRTAHYRVFYQSTGITDRIWISFPVNVDIESHFVFDRKRPHRPFTPRQLELAAYTLRGVAWFHRQALLSYGLLIARNPLSPMQRRVLALLLTDASEKGMAAALRQSFHTTHTHVREVFRRFGVASRASLMAVWLNGR
jgi:Response regulator containing a CheY-like receiver domain and an HTH DNA-binding domain